MDLLPRIEIDGASKTIGNSVVLDQIQLTVKPGEMIGLQGVNGSGKTMLLRLISGLIYPTKGHVLIDGKMLGSDLSFLPASAFSLKILRFYHNTRALKTYRCSRLFIK